LQEEFSLRTQALMASSSLMPLPQHDPLTHKCLLCSLILGRTWEYFRATHTLEPFSPTPTSLNTISVLIALHLNLDGYIPFFLKDYKLNQDLKLSFDSFKLSFQHMPDLLASGHSRMGFEHFRDCFHLEDLVSGYSSLFQFSYHIAKGHIPPQITHVLGMVHLLAMTKPLGGVHPITVGETLYQFTNCAL